MSGKAAAAVVVSSEAEAKPDSPSLSSFGPKEASALGAADSADRGTNGSVGTVFLAKM